MLKDPRAPRVRQRGRKVVRGLGQTEPESPLSWVIYRAVKEAIQRRVSIPLQRLIGA